jgi:hypothetical protein
MKRTFIFGALAAALIASGASAHAGGSACPTTNPPNELVLVGGSGQTAQLGKPFAQSFQTELANSNGCPLTGNLAGVTVNFDAPGSRASGIFAGTGSREAYVGTDAQGIATAPPFTANDTAGTYTVDAHSDYGSVEIALSNTAGGLPSSIAATGPTSQEATINGRYGGPLQARVTDADGNPVQGASVTFAILPGTTGAGASFLGGEPSATTDSNGLATSPPFVANGVPGRFSAIASTQGVQTVVTYALDNHAATTTLRSAMHDPKATVGTRYRALLRARLADAAGQPIEGATVTFAVTASETGAGAIFLGGTAEATALTDVDGVATAPPLVADKTAGAFTATATSPGASSSRYTLVNVAAAPVGIAPGAANGQSTTVGTRFAIPLAVTVTDAGGNPVGRTTVTFTAPRNGASGRFGMRRLVYVKTNAKGIAVAPPFTANASVGGYVVTATVGRSSARTAVALLNLPRG